MVLLTIWPFFLAVLYVRNFQKSDSLDNHYIDSHFLEIDKARAINGQPTLLPLLPKEKKMYISTCNVRMRVKEKLLMCLQHVFLLFSMLPIGVFILVDIFDLRLQAHPQGLCVLPQGGRRLPHSLHLQTQGYVHNGAEHGYVGLVFIRAGHTLFTMHPSQSHVSELGLRTTVHGSCSQCQPGTRTSPTDGSKNF